MTRVFIIGGARGIGRWFAQNVTTKHLDVYDTFLCDVSFNCDDRLGSTTEVILGESSSDVLLDFVTPSSIVIFAVPIDKLEECLNEVARQLPKGCLVVNFSSVQAITNESINKRIGGDRTAVGIHLMFGPGTQTLAGKNVIVTDFEEPIHSSRLKKLLRIMENEGAYIEYSSADLHDRMMNLMQTLVHFVYLAFAKYLSVSAVRPKDILKFQTLPSAYFFSFVARVMLQGKLTYANIQSQPGAQETREAFLDTALLLAKDIVDARDSATLASHFEEISENFDQADLNRLFTTTENSILTFADDALEFQNLMQSNELVLVKERSDGSDETTWVGFVSENRKDTFVLRRAVFRRASESSENTSKFCFWGDEFDDYAQNLRPPQNSIDQEDVVQNFVEINKSRSQISSGVVLQEWLTRSVDPIVQRYCVVLDLFDKKLIMAFCRKLETSNICIVSADASSFKIVGDKDVHFTLAVQFFPPLVRKGIEELIDEILALSFDGNASFSVADAGGS